MMINIMIMLFEAGDGDENIELRFFFFFTFLYSCLILEKKTIFWLVHMSTF